MVVTTCAANASMQQLLLVVVAVAKIYIRPFWLKDMDFEFMSLTVASYQVLETFDSYQAGGACCLFLALCASLWCIGFCCGCAARTGLVPDTRLKPVCTTGLEPDPIFKIALLANGRSVRVRLQ